MIEGFSADEQQVYNFLRKIEEEVYEFSRGVIRRQFSDLNSILRRKFDRLFKRDEENKARNWKEFEEVDIDKLHDQVKL